MTDFRTCGNGAIVRYGEIGIKGQNRGDFERRLLSNIHDLFRKENLNLSAKRLRGRIAIFGDDVKKKEFSRLKRVFGIISFSRAKRCQSNIENIKSVIKDEFGGKVKGKKFRVSARRLDKSFSMKSMDVNIEIGSFVEGELGGKVDLTDFDVNIGIEISDGDTFIFDDVTDTLKCYGGLPVGSEGNCVVLVEDIYSAVAAWLMMKRGVKAELAFMHESEEVRAALGVLKKYRYGFKMMEHPVKDFSSIRSLMQDYEIDTLVLGEPLERRKVYDGADEVFILRPLEGMEKDEIFSIYGNMECD